MSLKNSVTPPGIDPGTVLLVAQRLNHYATPGPFSYTVQFKIHLITFYEGREHIYSYTLSLTSVLDGVGGQRHGPAALPPRKRPGTHCIGG
jgi:hypothetical protein